MAGDRAAVGAMLRMDDLIDVIVPRGGRSLIERVSAESRIPVLKHLDGICHVYLHAAADPAKAVRIAVNESLMKLRKRKSDKTVSLDEGVDTGEEVVVREIAVWDGDPEQQYTHEEMRAILDEAVAGLRPAFRSVFVLRDIEELSTEETAQALDLSVPAVKSRLLRARLQLREKLTRVFKRKGDDVFALL